MNLLFLDVGNSTCSILAEAILNAQDGEQVRAWSAGTRPDGAVHPLTYEILETVGMPVAALRSKHPSEIGASDSSKIDIVIALTEGIAADSAVTGAAVQVRWHLPDPAEVSVPETAQLTAFADTFRILEQYIQALLGLPLQFLSADELRQQLELLIES